MSFHTTDKAGRPNMNFPLDLFESMNPTFTEEGLSKSLPISWKDLSESANENLYFSHSSLATSLYSSGTLW